MTNVQTHRDSRISPLLLAALASTTFATTAVYYYLSLRHALLSPVWIYLSLYFVAYAVYIYIGLRILPKLSSSPNLWVPLILVFGIVFRLLLVDSPPSISSDIYRYVWDGRLTMHGINPYRWAPFDPRLAMFRDTTIWYPMDYKYYNTIYMPVSQGIFAAIYAIGGASLSAFKLSYVLFDAVAMGLIVLILRERILPISNVYWYAWCPLPITELGLAGHQDIVGVVFLLAAILLALRRRPMRAGILLIAAAFTKGFAFLILPAMCRRFGRQFATYVLVAFVVLGLPLWFELRSFTHGMSQYLSTVHVNSGLFHFVYVALRSFVPGYAYFLTSRLGNLATLGIIWWSVRTPVVSDQDMIRRATIVIAVCLMVVPTLFPWYIIWLLPLALILRPKPAYSFIALSGTVALMYLYYCNYTILWWFRVIEYVPFYYLLWREMKAGYWTASDGGLVETGVVLTEGTSGDGLLPESPVVGKA